MDVREPRVLGGYLVLPTVELFRQASGRRAARTVALRHLRRAVADYQRQLDEMTADLVEELYTGKAKLTQTQIAVRIGASAPVVNRLLVARGVQARRPGRRRNADLPAHEAADVVDAA